MPGQKSLQYFIQNLEGLVKLSLIPGTHIPRLAVGLPNANRDCPDWMKAGFDKSASGNGTSGPSSTILILDLQFQEISLAVLTRNPHGIPAPSFKP